MHDAHADRAAAETAGKLGGGSGWPRRPGSATEAAGECVVFIRVDAEMAADGVGERRMVWSPPARSAAGRRSPRLPPRPHRVDRLKAPTASASGKSTVVAGRATLAAESPGMPPDRSEGGGNERYHQETASSTGSRQQPKLLGGLEPVAGEQAHQGAEGRARLAWRQPCASAFLAQVSRSATGRRCAPPGSAPSRGGQAPARAGEVPGRSVTRSRRCFTTTLRPLHLFGGPVVVGAGSAGPRQAP